MVHLALCQVKDDHPPQRETISLTNSNETRSFVSPFGQPESYTKNVMTRFQRQTPLCALAPNNRAKRPIYPRCFDEVH